MENKKDKKKIDPKKRQEYYIKKKTKVNIPLIEKANNIGQILTGEKSTQYVGNNLYGESKMKIVLFDWLVDLEY